MSNPPKPKRQKTLAAWHGFTKNVRHRGELVPVNIPSEINLVTCTIECPKCKQRFKSNQGLGVYKLACLRGEDAKLKDDAHPSVHV